MLEVALSCIRRGWWVFPCWPKTKKPMTKRGWHDASNDEAKIREWWAKTPRANVAIACNPSNLCVVDIDHGLNEDAEALGWLGRNHFPQTYIVRTGRRPEMGLQVYFEGTMPDIGLWKVDGCEGQVKSAGGYVMAAGSVHPDSGEIYSVHHESPLALTPQWVRELKPERIAVTDEPITSNRNVALTSIAGKLRNAGLSAAALEVSLLQVNADRCVPPMDDDEVKRIAANAARWELPKEDPKVVLGILRPEVDASQWRSLFHTAEEIDNISDPEFLIKDFLQAESVTGIIGPARARKSIVTLNIIHSLLTGEKLFGRFEVPNRPERVVYLCPEAGVKSLGRRVRNMQLRQFLGKSFFFTSMNSDPVALDDPRLREAVKGSVLFIDTAIRFFNGDENSSQDMKRFGEQCHGLIRDGVQSVVLLHHTNKNSEGLSLENGRGSGDFGGFLTCCWGTTLDDYDDAYNSHSLMSCVKQRDFQADSFKVAPSGNQDNFFLQYIDGSENARVQVGAKAKAGKAQAMAFIKAHPELSSEALSGELAKQGIKYSPSSCRTMMRAAKGVEIHSD